MAALICSADALHAFGAANHRKTLTAAIARPSPASLGCTVSNAAACRAIARSHGQWQPNLVRWVTNRLISSCLHISAGRLIGLTNRARL